MDRNLISTDLYFQKCVNEYMSWNNSLQYRISIYNNVTLFHVMFLKCSSHISEIVAIWSGWERFEKRNNSLKKINWAIL